MPTIAVDPGVQGGAVLLGDAGRPVACWAWHRLKRKGGDVYRLDEAHGPSIETDHIAGVGALLNLAVCELTHGETLHLAVEGLFVPREEPEDEDDAKVAALLPPTIRFRGKPRRKGGSVPAALELARVVGWLTAGLVQRAASVVMPKAAVWRPAVLGVRANASSDESERVALLRWRTLWRGELVDDPHVAEAAAVGAWAVAQRRLTEAR